MSQTKMTGRDRMLAMLEHQPVDCLPCLPITMAFACDCIDAKYHAYATDYRVQVEAQIRTAEIFDFDHVSVISDPAVEAADCGAGIAIYPNEPPSLDEARAFLRDKKKLKQLRPPDPTAGRRMSNRLEAIRVFKERVGQSKLIEGWIEGPCAQSSNLRGINALMVDFFDDPAFVHDLLQFTVEMELWFAREQIAVGADIIGIGDAASSLVGPKIYEEFIFPYQKNLIDRIHGNGAYVRLHICGNTSRTLKHIGALKADIVDIDYPTSLDLARQAFGPEQIITGNIDPVRDVMDSTPESILADLGKCRSYAGQNYIPAPGCEIPRNTPAENVHAIVKYARQQYR